jgi:hypothetical protein
MCILDARLDCRVCFHCLSFGFTDILVSWKATATVENVYGIDYATNLSEVMEVAPRASTIDKYINAYLFLSDKGQAGKAADMLAKLKTYLGGEIPKKLQNELNSKNKPSH